MASQPECPIDGLTSALNVACTTFRTAATPSRFYRWPERHEHTLCCGSGALLANYSYPGRPCEPLVTGIYYDVRLAGRLGWYFLHWDFSFLDKTHAQAVTACEYSLLHRFYKHWFATNVFFHGVLFGFALIVVTQGVVVCMWRFGLRRPLAMWSDDYDAALIACFHMGLLGVNGFATMVAAGHGALLSFPSDSFSCAMSLYSYLTLLSVFCMVFEHLAYEDDFLLGEKLHVALRRGLARTDWRWQPVWAQVAAGICMYMYSTGVETSLGQLDQGAAQAIPIVVLAIFWSGGHMMVFVVEVAEHLFIELLKVGGVIAKLRAFGVLKPSTRNTPAASLPGQVAATTAPINPSPVSGTPAANLTPAPISATTAPINPSPVSGTPAANLPPAPISATTAPINPSPVSGTPAANLPPAPISATTAPINPSPVSGTPAANLPPAPISATTAPINPSPVSGTPAANLPPAPISATTAPINPSPVSGTPAANLPPAPSSATTTTNPNPISSTTSANPSPSPATTPAATTPAATTPAATTPAATTPAATTPAAVTPATGATTP